MKEDGNKVKGMFVLEPQLWRLHSGAGVRKCSWTDSQRSEYQMARNAISPLWTC